MNDSLVDEEVLHDLDTNNSQRFLIMGALTVVLLAFGGVYLVWASGRAETRLLDREIAALEAIEAFEESQNPSPTPLPQTPVATVEPTAIPLAEEGFAPLPGEVMAVNLVPGGDYGKLLIRHADGTRTLLDQSCIRVHIAAQHGICLAEQEGLIGSFTTTFFSTANPAVTIKQYASTLPSRARISPEGTFSSATAFISGSSYEDIGEEASTVVLVDEIETTSRVLSVQQFVIESDEDRYQNVFPEYWGMTFANEDEFYITAFVEDEPEIMFGSIQSMSVEPTGWVGSCPSLSPDGKTLVYKQARDDGGFDLIALDLESQERWTLGETASVDDQVEWLDNDTILYGVHPEGGDRPVQPVWDIWMLDIAEGSEPQLFLPSAASPAVAR